jgi:hypothetical protein
LGVPFASDEVVDYVLDAVDIIAGSGYRLLADYTFDPGSGLWRHLSAPPLPTSLEDVVLDLAGPPTLATDRDALAGYLDAARRIVHGRPDHIGDGPTGLPASFEALREFHLPPRCLLR